MTREEALAELRYCVLGRSRETPNISAQAILDFWKSTQAEADEVKAAFQTKRDNYDAQRTWNHS